MLATWHLLTKFAKKVMATFRYRGLRQAVDYIQALGEGEVKIAYARIILIGPGGVGKSSLLNGLMNLPLPDQACSTQLADTYTLRRANRPTKTFWAKKVSGGYWVRVTNRDEINELVHLVEAINEDQQSSSETDVSKASGHGASIRDKFAHSSVKPIVEELASNLKLSFSGIRASMPGMEVYMCVWDCGGQPVFLDLLPAFLTSRTLFLLMFDARRDLQAPCLHLSHHKGKAKKEQQEITTLELLTQWMATIHATLLKKPSSDAKEASTDVNSLGGDTQAGNFPKILPIGTHGDDAKVKALGDAIFKPLTSAYADKAFMHLVLDGLVVDNTTAGKGEHADPTFQEIRDIADNFASTDVAIRTPIRWVLFRKVFERYAKGRPVVPLEKVKELGRACFISDKAMDSVLAFYHDLAVFFHYVDIPSLRKVVIADPQWLIRQMAKIMALEGFEIVKQRTLWKLLREDGILVEKLYKKVLSTQQELTPQEIIDLLEYFLIIAEIHTTGKHSCPGREYFAPSLLPRCPVIKSSFLATSNVQSATPLHLIFSTKYLPPGFITRLAAVMSKHPKCQVDFTSKIYRNEVKYLFGSAGQQVDKFVITEKKFSVCVQVQRVSTRFAKYPTFISTCNELFQIMQESFTDIKKWLPQIDVSFALECETCPEKGHFIPLSALPSITPNTSLLCQKNVRTVLNTDQKFWLYIHQDHPAKSDLSDYEICELAKEINHCGKVRELAGALEMADQLGSVSIDATILLQRWRDDMETLKTPTRKHLMHHLTSIGLQHLQERLLYDEFTPGSYSDTFHKFQDKLDWLDRENSQLKNEISQLKSENSHLKKRSSELRKENSQLKSEEKSELSSLQQEIQQLQARVRAHELRPPPLIGHASPNVMAMERSSQQLEMPSPDLEFVENMAYETRAHKPSLETVQPRIPNSAPRFTIKTTTTTPQFERVTLRADGSASSRRLADQSGPSRRLADGDYNWICDKLRPHASKWKTIGQSLGFLAAELSNIEAAPTNHINAPHSYLYAMVDSWLQWAPRDERGSQDYARLKYLSRAVDKAGLGVLAQSLLGHAE